jgi:single-strand DNA-binding protein
MSLNKVILIGNVGKDPEVRYFDSGAAIANFPMATSERGYTLANGTVVPERTEWHNIVVRRDQVNFVEKWVKKGSGVYVEGKIRTRTYDDQAGVKRYVTEIHADRVEFFSFGRSEASSSQASTVQASGSQPAAVQQPSTVQVGASPSPQPPVTPTPGEPSLPSVGGEGEDSDPDDLPF